MQNQIDVLNARLAALEAKVQGEIDYNLRAFIENDEQIHRAIAYADTCSKRTWEFAQERVASVESRINAAESKEAEAIVESVKQLLAGSSSEVVAAALAQMLQSSVLVTRPASREELRSGKNVVTVRSASAAEIRGPR